MRLPARRATMIVGLALCARAVVAGQAPMAPPDRIIDRQELVAPGALRPLPRADAALARRSLDQVAEAIAPLRGEAPPPVDAPPSAVILEARRRVAAGQVESAVQFLAEHLRRDSSDIQAWRELGRLLDAVGRRDLAHEAWGRVLAKQPLDPEALAFGGIDAASARQPLAAAERLLKYRQMARVGEAPQPEPREAIGQAVALGLSLRELGYLRAAVQCLEEAWRASEEWKGPDAAPMRRQAADLMRIAGECALASGEPARAADAFRRALDRAPPEDRVALVRWTWACVQADDAAEAVQGVGAALAKPGSPGRAGLPGAIAVLPESARPTMGAEDLRRVDVLALRASTGVDADARAGELLRRGSDRLQFGPALASIAERRGPARAVDVACARAAEDPWLAQELAAGLRATAATPSSLRQAFGDRRDGASRLVRAHFEILGGEANAAAAAAAGAEEPGALGAALRAVAALAAGALENAEGLHRIGEEPVVAASVAAALADAFVAIGDRAQADRWAERAIELEQRSADAWMARARADLLPPEQGDRPDGSQARLIEARLAAERAWDAAPARSDTVRMLLQLLAPESAQRAESIELVRGNIQADAALRELDRAEALRRVQLGQGEPALDPLRTLLSEDPLDAEVARALVSAAAAAGQLDQTEPFLRDLQVRRPCAAAPLEALVTALAKRGRLDEGVALLREAAQAEPESLSRRLAWARALSVAARADEAWSVFDSLPRVEGSPRLLLERAEFALRARREDAAMEALRAVASAPRLTSPQRLSALSLALRVSRDAPGRRELAAGFGVEALATADAGPQALAAAMLVGDPSAAQELAAKRARAWGAQPSLDAAQSLVDEGEPGRAAALLEAIAGQASPKDRAVLVRARLAALSAAGDDRSALETLLRERGARGSPVLMDASDADEAAEINELAGMFMMAGHDRAAARLFERCLSRRPDQAEALNNLAWLRILEGRRDAETAELVERALRAESPRPSTLDTAGWWSYLSGAPIAECLERLRGATSGADPGLEPLDHLGDALWVAGRRDDATAAWRSVAERARGSGSRAAAMQAFDRMQSRRAGIRAWNAASFYDARDGAAIARAQAKLQAIAEGREPPIAPRPPAPPASAPVPAP